ncbi:oligoendopeptidase F [Clostridiaceae bacterium HFYG-1003]|nr:oligoendopeptidase F [Clostridiaceae bacterium HFYG-1003]
MSQANEEKKVLRRDEVDPAYTWNLKDIFPSDEAFYQAQDRLAQAITAFTGRYRGHLSDAAAIVAAVRDYEQILITAEQCGNYAHLHVSEDRTNPLYQKNMMEFQAKMGGLVGELSFFESELLQVPEAILSEAMAADPNYSFYLKDVLRYKPHTLSPESEMVLARLGEVFDAPYSVYEAAKLADLNFPEFEANGEKHLLTFINFEGELEYDKDMDVRRNAFRAFSEKLREYQYTIGTAYASNVRQEKILSELKHYDSVFDYLLMRQKVDRPLYDRQLDVLMAELAPHMRRYAKLIQRVHGLDKMTYADLKLDLDPAFEPSISIEESKDYIYNALSILGDDYVGMLREALDNRWVDFVQNKGKSTGAFCASPFGVHPYILISWTYKMREVFVLAHELGHAGHSFLTHRSQTPLNDNLSLYAIEAPSTMNEMLMANYLMKSSDEPRFRRWVIASIIARTYYHNFVTHFLEGYYQREVYRLIDAGTAVQTEDFHRIFRETLEKFWGDTVELTEGAELTWMRQPHYYMGLYPYTYSAGLTISTAVSQRILKEGQPAVDDWRNVLSAGGTLTPVEFAKAAGVDITTDKPLRDTVSYIGSLIDELEKLTDELEQN